MAIWLKKPEIHMVVLFLVIGQISGGLIGVVVFWATDMIIDYETGFMFDVAWCTGVLLGFIGYILGIVKTKRFWRSYEPCHWLTLALIA